MMWEENSSVFDRKEVGATTMVAVVLLKEGDKALTHD